MLAARVYIVDDHPLVREGLTTKLEKNSLTVCGENGDARQALTEIGALQPDVALIDLSLVDASGLDLINHVHKRYPMVKLIAISMHSETLYGSQVKSAGGLGYVNKREISDQIVKAVERVLAGKTFFCKNEVDTASKLKTLSKRESEVFELIGQGLTIAEIADSLAISVKTVETHRENIKVKLNIESSHALTVYASRMNMI